MEDDDTARDRVSKKKRASFAPTVAKTASEKKRLPDIPDQILGDRVAEFLNRLVQIRSLDSTDPELRETVASLLDENPTQDETADGPLSMFSVILRLVLTFAETSVDRFGNVVRKESIENLLKLTGFAFLFSHTDTRLHSRVLLDMCFVTHSTSNERENAIVWTVTNMDMYWFRMFTHEEVMSTLTANFSLRERFRPFLLLGTFLFPDVPPSWDTLLRQKLTLSEFQPSPYASVRHFVGDKMFSLRTKCALLEEKYRYVYANRTMNVAIMTALVAQYVLKKGNYEEFLDLYERTIDIDFRYERPNVRLLVETLAVSLATFLPSEEQICSAV